MARKRRSSNTVQSTRANAISQSRSLTTLFAPGRSLVTSPVLSGFEDNRFYHPDPEHAALTIGGKYASVTVHERPVLKRSQALRRWGFGGRGVPIGLQVPVGIKFQHPFNVATCVRRKIRRSVLFARNKAGKSGRRGRYRRTWKSAIWC